ncbi:MAG TPA: cysteine desulfurase [Kiritimatiellia bacterium]|nr:cysteine desulfurase [Kiritimatiellia bacterium]HMP32852.1 cysteine desulfurase [Kiritimatiellia bacterium]
MTSVLPFDAEAFRARFPILGQPVRDGKPLVYLDSAATTQKPVEVLDNQRDYYTTMNANVHRGIHRLAELATEHYENARVKVARFIGAPDPRSIVFTRGTTEAINLVAQSWGRAHLTPGDTVVLTAMEHHSNIVPWQLVAATTGAKLAYIPFTPEGELDLAAFERLMQGPVKLVALTHMSNVLGTINPVESIIAAAHRAGAVVLVDGAQSVPFMPIDVAAMDCDFLAFSGHKMMAPTGIGVLYAKPALLEAMPPFLGGGEMISKVTLESSTWAEIPHKFEAGTPNIAGTIGLGAAIDVYEAMDRDGARRHEEALTAYAIERLMEVDGLILRGRAARRGGAVSFSIAGVHPHDIAHFVDQDGIAVRAGHMCAQPLIRQLGETALTRASLYFYNTRADIDALVASLLRVKRFFDRAP